MAKEDIKELKGFIKVFPKEIQDTVFALRDFVWKLYPKTNEIIYDNYNAVAFGWSITEKLGHTFCTIAIGRSSYNIHFGFYYGADLKDPDNILIGKGNQYRYILVEDFKNFPKGKMKNLLKEAYANSYVKVKDLKEIKNGLTIVKSVSEKKRSISKKTLTLKSQAKKKTTAAKKIRKEN